MSKSSHDKVLKMNAIAHSWHSIMQDILTGDRLDLDGVLRGLKDISAGKFNDKKLKKNITKVIDDSGLQIGPLSGRRTIYGSKLFRGGVDSYFAQFGLNRKGIATKRSKLRLARMKDAGSFADIFYSLSVDFHYDSLAEFLGDVWMTQDQFCEFCKKFPGELDPELCNFALVKIDDWAPAIPENLTVCYAKKTKDGWRTDVGHFTLRTEWKKPHQIIFRQPRLQRA